MVMAFEIWKFTVIAGGKGGILDVFAAPPRFWWIFFDSSRSFLIFSSAPRVSYLAIGVSTSYMRPQPVLKFFNQIFTPPPRENLLS